MYASWVILAGLVLATLHECDAGHYSGSCASDEVAGEIQGETGIVCAPKCAANTYECALDVPSGTTAQPQCMLQNVDQAFYCGLLCQVDAQCPSGASCRKVGTQAVGLCIHPLSFSDWARQTSRTKLGIGFPTAPAGKSSKGFQIAKAYSALQSLKRRYAISDGDAEVLTVKEMLSAVSSTSDMPDTSRHALQKFEDFLHKATHPDQSGLAAAVSNDMRTLGNNLASGLPGVAREAESVVWNVEHIENRGAAAGLLRGIIEVAMIYLICGCIYKHQALGSRGIDMIPHIGFWTEYPALVADGVKYASQLVSEFTTAGKGSGFASAGGSTGGFQPLGAPSAERDTFSNFEPSR